VDLDGDGCRDILSGSYSREEQPMAGLFQVLWGQSDGTFKKAATLLGNDGKPLIIPVAGGDWVKNICTRPFAVDWDGDGDLDLVVGNFFGTFYLFHGKGKGKFLPAPEEIKSGKEPLQIQGNHSDPFVVDWDGDGDLDLVSGSNNGGVQWAENHAGPRKPPQLEQFRSLIRPRAQPECGQIVRAENLEGPVSCTRVWVDDFNSDGELDVLVGDRVTLMSPADHVTEAEFKTKFAAWDKSLREASRQLNSAIRSDKERSEAQQRYQEVHSQRSEFMHEEMTGFLWLYLRK
jgi:hypothetical protein